MTGLAVKDARPADVPADAVSVAVCQLAPEVGKRDANLDRAVEVLGVAADHGASLVVLPELVSSGYVFADAAELHAVAEPGDGETVTRLSAVARERGLVVVAGFPELGDGCVYNSAVVVDADGRCVFYRKAHLWDAENELFTPGGSKPAVVDTAVGRVGVVVCYDLEFPEWLRLAALDGADIVCAPTNWPAEPRPDGERPVEVVRLQATASVNHVFVAAADRTGPERGVEWVGGSAVVAPDGFPLVLADREPGEQLLLASCQLADARDKRISPRNDVMADRRPDLYGPVVGYQRDRYLPDS